MEGSFVIPSLGRIISCSTVEELLNNMSIDINFRNHLQQKIGGDWGQGWPQEFWFIKTGLREQETKQRRWGNMQDKIYIDVCSSIMNAPAY
jgi:hypothetical protein